MNSSNRILHPNLLIILWLTAFRCYSVLSSPLSIPPTAISVPSAWLEEVGSRDNDAQQLTLDTQIFPITSPSPIDRALYYTILETLNMLNRTETPGKIRHSQHQHRFVGGLGNLQRVKRTGSGSSTTTTQATTTARCQDHKLILCG
ncbi:uncharacterized protein [Amphiura filiformis]|uniref:uncharacterized protein n=1 Tax=Amphiura filiformis TaxID=82378 RepID=UPI003B20EA40